MTSTLKINGTHDPDTMIDTVLHLMEGTSDRDVEVDIQIDGPDMQLMRDALVKGVCISGYHAGENGNVPGFYIIRHDDDEPTWRREYRYMSIFCGRVTFTKENA